MLVQNFFSCIRALRYIVEYIIAPPVCYACKSFIRQRVILCQSCDDLILPIAPKIFRINASYTMVVHAVCKYDNNPVKLLILSKHRSDYVLIEGLAQLIWEKTIISHMHVDYVVPIPLHWSRRLKRGFNQSEILACTISAKMNAQVFNQLTRTRKTEYQARLEKEYRNDNVKGAFKVLKHGELLQNKHIVLIDDLCTTGSTAIEVAKVLARYKPASISLLVASRAL